MLNQFFDLKRNLEGFKQSSFENDFLFEKINLFKNKKFLFLFLKREKE
jgi:hypothetical protein